MDPDPIRSVAAEAAAPHSLEPTSGPLTFEELQLAGRNRGMPLEALRYATTPTGLHYLLVHWDIPGLDADGWRLRVEGLVRKPLQLTLADLRARPAVTLRVTMECAGNGRARLEPRPLSQPWLNEAIGTAEWTGTPLAPILEEAGLADGAVEIVFTGADRGIQGGIEQDYGRSLAIADATRPEVMIATAMNGQPLQPQHGYPRAPARAGLVRDGERQVADVDPGGRGAVHGIPADTGLPVPARRGRSRRAGDEDAACGRS